MSVEFGYRVARSPKWPLVGALALFFAELLIIGTTFKHGINFNCLANWPGYACAGFSGLLISIYCMCAALALFAYLFPGPFVRLFEVAGQRIWPLGVNIVGTLIAMVPVTFMQEGSGTGSLIPALIFWSIGMTAILTGLLLYLAPLDHWIRLLSEEKWRLLPLIIGSLVAPATATLIRPLWQLDAIASLTFSAVSRVIQLLGYEVEAYPETRVIGLNDFYIDIAPVCSGVEGIALVTVFITLYFFLFRAELRFPRALIVYPLGIAVSAALNVLRIVVLLIIGLEGNSELAVGGFHSHAGWLMFTIVSLGVIALVNNVPWLRKPAQTVPAMAKSASSAPPFFQDLTVAMILPFAVFMFSALLAQAFSQQPGVVYPARAALMAGALWMFWPLYRKLDWQLDWIAVGVGAVIGLAWVLIPVPEPDTTPPYGTLSGGLLVLWFVARGIGTSLLVPVIEELFFRGYLEQRFKRNDTVVWAIAAATAVAAIFGLLHDRWIEAVVASLAFSFVMHRSGRVTDAIVAHGVANAIVFAVAAGTGQVHII